MLAWFKPDLPRLPWPDGTTFFAFRTWVALALGYYAAFWLQLDGASSAGVCVLILAQPQQGMVLSKSVYRFIATLVGGIAAVSLTALFPQDRVMLLASFALVMALQTALGTLFRDFRSYACILAGYTIAIISVANIDHPQLVFASAIDRVAAITVGVAAIAVTNAFLASAEASQSLMAKMRDATRDVVGLARDAIEHREPPDAQTCVDLSAKLMSLRSQITFAMPEKPRGRVRARGARSALLGLFEALSAIQAVGLGLQKLTIPSPVVDQALDQVRSGLASQKPERYAARVASILKDAVRSTSLSIDEAYVLDRLMFLLESVSLVRDGLLALRVGRQPRRTVSISVHQDWVAVALNAARMLVAIAIVSALSVLSGHTDTATAVLFTSVFVSLGAVQPDPNVMGRAALFGMPAVVLAGIVYAFFIFPNIDGFPLFILSLMPLVFAMCWLVKLGMSGAGLIFGVQTIVLISPSNVQTLDPASFATTATMLVLSGIAIPLSFLLILPVDPALRRLRLALAVGTALRDALADERRLNQPRASLQYDRLAQFKTWQGQKAPTLARLKEMKRLVDIGNLSFAVRRSWRSLDKAKSLVDVDLDRESRATLPRLTRTKTLGLAERYLRAAHDQSDDGILVVVRAAGALHGTALATGRETRLLRRIGLLEFAA